MSCSENNCRVDGEETENPDKAKEDIHELINIAATSKRLGKYAR